MSLGEQSIEVREHWEKEGSEGYPDAIRMISWNGLGDTTLD